VIKDISFPRGYAVITDESGNKTEKPVTAKLAQVVMILLRVLIERDLVDDSPLRDYAGNEINLQSILDTLIDEYSAEYENERKATIQEV
jgi:hypothetical protein